MDGHQKSPDHVGGRGEFQTGKSTNKTQQMGGASKIMIPRFPADRFRPPPGLPPHPGDRFGIYPVPGWQQRRHNVSGRKAIGGCI